MIALRILNKDKEHQAGQGRGLQRSFHYTYLPPVRLTPRDCPHDYKKLAPLGRKVSTFVTPYVSRCPF